MKNSCNKRLCPEDFTPENSSVWSFKSRGNWATHNGNYRGNWSPYIPRNIILRYSSEEDLVLDYFCGAGTTAVECKLLNRSFIGVDINPSAVKLAKMNLNINQGEPLFNAANIRIETGDAKNLNIADNSIDLICAHPPYSDIINYTYDNPDDLSHLKIDDFLNSINKVAGESFRVLKDNKYCVILIGDMRKSKNVVPLGFFVIEKFLGKGFKMQELIIKRQHNCKTTGFWYKNSIKYNFLLLAHEYLIVFKKQAGNSHDVPEPGKEMLCRNYFKENNLFIKKDISLEAKTVWISDKNSWLADAVSNLLSRYSRDSYLIYENQDFNNIPLKDEKFDLIILQNQNSIFDKINILKKNLNNNGILALICEDFRLKSGFIESHAINIEKFLRSEEDLKIKEIIVLAQDNDKNFEAKNFLEINHRYILIYKKN